MSKITVRQLNTGYAVYSNENLVMALTQESNAEIIAEVIRQDELTCKRYASVRLKAKEQVDAQFKEQLQKIQSDAIKSNQQELLDAQITGGRKNNQITLLLTNDKSKIQHIQQCKCNTELYERELELKPTDMFSTRIPMYRLKDGSIDSQVIHLVNGVPVPKDVLMKAMIKLNSKSKLSIPEDIFSTPKVNDTVSNQQHELSPKHVCIKRPAHADAFSGHSNIPNKYRQLTGDENNSILTSTTTYKQQPNTTTVTKEPIFVTFEQAVSSNKHIRHKYWDKYLTLNDAMRILNVTDTTALRLEYLSGNKWEIKPD